MTETARLGLPLLEAGQAQKEVTHNESLLAIDRLLQLGVASRQIATPPTTPLAGNCYIVPVGATGAWANKQDRLASYDGFGWIFIVPKSGCLAWIADEAVFSVFDGGWQAGGWPVSALRISGRTVLSADPVLIDAPTGGATVDTECRAAIGTLLSALRAQGLIA